MATVNRFADAAQTMNEELKQQNAKQRADKVIRSILQTQPDMNVCLLALQSVIVSLNQMMQEAKEATKGKMTKTSCTEIQKGERWYSDTSGDNNYLPHANWPVDGKLSIPMICYTLQLKDIILHVNALYLLKSFGVWHVERHVVFSDPDRIAAFLECVETYGVSNWPRVPMYYYWTENMEGKAVYFPENRARAQSMGMYISPYTRSLELGKVEEYVREILSRSLELIPPH